MRFHYLPFPLFGSLLLSACVATEPEPLGDVGDTGDTQGQSSTNTPADSGGQADDNGGTQGATSTTDATGTTNATTPGTDDGNDTEGVGDTEGDMSTGDEPGTTGGEPVDCSVLDEAACDAEPSCFGLQGQEILQNALGFCYGPPQFLYCLEADVACPPATATVCSMGSFYEAWSACPLPGGWMACDPPGMVNGDC